MQRCASCPGQGQLTFNGTVLSHVCMVRSQIMHTSWTTPAQGQPHSFSLACHVSDGGSSLTVVPVHRLLACHVFKQDLDNYNVRHASSAQQGRYELTDAL